MASQAIDHAGQMDKVYRGQRHIYDLTRRYYLLGRDRAIETLDPPRGGSVLEIGCGTGRNIVKAAQHWPAACFYGLDISSEMLKSASTAVSHAGLTSQVALGRGDATGFDAKALFGRTSFDRLLFSYTLSMIPDWQNSLRQGLDLLAPGGQLHLIDFGDQTGLPRWFQRLQRRWLARFHVTPRDTLPAWLAEESARRGYRCEIRPLYRSYAILGRVTA